MSKKLLVIIGLSLVFQIIFVCSSNILQAQSTIGTLSIVRDPYFSSGDIYKGTTDQTVAKFNLTSKYEDIIIQTIKIKRSPTYTDTGTDPILSKAKLKDSNNNLIAQSPTVDVDGVATFSNLNWTAEVGTNKLIITTDIPSDFSEANFYLIIIPSVIEAVGVSSGESVSDISPNVDIYGVTMIVIDAPSIAVTSPNGGESWKIGEKHTIKWTDEGIKNYTIVLVRPDGYAEWGLNATLLDADTKEYQWEVGSMESCFGSCELPPPGNYYIEVKGQRLDDPEGTFSVSDRSDTIFSIVEAKPDLAITDLKYWSPQTNTPTIESYIGYEITIKNIGNTKLEGSYKETAYYDGNYLRYEGGISVPVNPGESWTTRQYTYKKIEKPGSHTIKLVIDSDNSIDELDETNNEKTITFIVPETTGCTDSDSGDDFYTKGYRIHYDPDHYGYGVQSWDYCIYNPDLSSSGGAIANSAKKVTECSGDKCYIIEYHCKTDLSDAHDSYQCPYGCQDGACFESVNGSCGSANGRYFASQPTTNLCSAGNATDVSIRWKDGYNVGYAWACNGIGETADDVSCVAYRTPSDSSITVLSPNGGEKLITGQTFIIKWLSSGIEGDVQLEFCIGALPGYRTCSPIKPSDATTYVGVPNTGLYDWEVPFRGTDAGAIYTINVWGINEFDSKIIGSSDAPFSIVEAGTPSVNITSPTSASTYWRKGETNTISWTLSNFDNAQCNIELYKINIASLARSIAINYSASQVFNNYSWTVPDDLEAGQYKTLVRCHNQGETITYEDKSDNYFSVIEAGAISPPTNVAVTGVETNQGKGLKISWVNPSDTSVRIYRSTTQNQLGNEYYSSLSTDTLFIDYNVSSNVTYYYTIHSYKEGDESTNTDQYSGNLSTPTPTPTPTPTECLPDNTLIKLPDDPKIYVIRDCKKKWIETIDEFQQGGHQWSDVQEVSSPVIQAYADYLETVATLLRGIGHQKVYRIVNNKRLWVPTISAFNAQGLKWSDIQDVQETAVEQYSRLKLAKLAGDEKIYYLTEGGLKKHIPSVEVFNSYGNQWTDVVEITTTELNAYPNVVLIRAEDDTKVYKLENNQKRWIKTIEAFNRLGHNWHEIAPVNAIEIDAYTIGDEIE